MAAVRVAAGFRRAVGASVLRTPAAARAFASTSFTGRLAPAGGAGLGKADAAASPRSPQTHLGPAAGEGRRAASGVATGAKPKGPYRKLAFFGAPGVGKGTFASRIAPIMGVPVISTGDMVRDEIKRGTKLGMEVEAINNAGDLVPDYLMSELVQKRLQEPDCANGFILDGYPRTLQQGHDAHEFAPLDIVIDFELPEWALIAKLTGRRVCNTCGRSFNVAEIKKDGLDMPPLLPYEDMCTTCDDTPPLMHRHDDSQEVIEHRLEVYHKATEPLIKFYAAEGLLYKFPVRLGLGDMQRLIDDLELDHVWVKDHNK